VRFAIEKAERFRGPFHRRVWFYSRLPRVGVRCGPADFGGSHCVRRLLHNYVHLYGRKSDQGVLLATVL
jgi:hypothetical protein